MDTALHTLSECSEWEEQKCNLVAAIGVGIFPIGNIIAAMVRSERVLNSAVFFCEQIVLKIFSDETGERDRKRFRTVPVR